MLLRNFTQSCMNLAWIWLDRP